MAGLARLLRVSENQAWTLLAAIVVAAIVSVGGVQALSHDTSAPSPLPQFVPIRVP